MLMGSALMAYGSVGEAPEPTVAYETFTSRDAAVFNRDFDINGSTCAIGLKKDGLCFGPSPLEELIVAGEALPKRAPAMPVRLEVLMATDLKAPGLKTYRYGHTLALVDGQSFRVIDTLDLSPSAYAGGGSAPGTSTTHTDS